MSDDHSADSKPISLRDRLVATLAEWTAHCLVATVLLVSFWGIEKLTHWLWDEEEGKLLWKVLPIQHIFDTADFAILAWFLLFGGYRTMRIYAGAEK